MGTNDTSAPRLRVLTFYFTEQDFVAVEASDLVAELAGYADRVVLDDDVIKDRGTDEPPIEAVGTIRVGPVTSPQGVTVTAPEGTVGMIPTVPR